MNGLPRPCLDCGALVAAGVQRCRDCARAYEQRRGTVAQRFGSGWGSLSRRIIARDGGICHVCGRDGADTVDHLIAKSRFADPRDANDESNLAACHRACNSAKGTR
jgi:5-methylcytosine-specific restriction endonuclease McrA